MRITLVMLLCAAGLLGQDAVRRGVQALREGRESDAGLAFREAVEADPRDRVALAALGSMAVQAEQWQEAAGWYSRVLALDPDNKAAHYTMGMIAWQQWSPALADAHGQSFVRPGWTQMLPDPALRARLRSEWWSILEEAIWHLERALEIDPDYREALVLLERLTRERAEIRETGSEFQQDIAAADRLAGRLRSLRWIRYVLSADAADRLLLESPQPVYPPRALEARIHGTVRLELIVNADGAVRQALVVSGHPLLVDAAVQAAKRRRYRALVVNGRPVQFATPVKIEFTLPRE